MNPRAGRLIAMATGSGNLTTAGLGLDTSRGDGHPTTMAAGSGLAVRGDGGPDRCGVQVSIVHSGRRHMCRSLDSEADLALDLVGVDGAVSDGCRLDLVTGSSRGGVAMEEDLERSVLIDLER